jgi:glyoxylase-like metal-dependent hydrolase (beta-lactamase superfamily II)
MAFLGETSSATCRKLATISGERGIAMSTLKIVRSALAVLALSGLAAPGIAQQPAQPQPPPPITMKQLKPDVWAGLGGSGGNSTIIIGKTSVIVVDAKQTEAGAKDLLAEIAKITPKPVTTAIITHSDGDHLNGLVAFPAGVKIIAHENNKKEQQAALAAGGRGAPPADRLPNQVVTKNKETMTVDGVKLELYHWAPAHTSGDLIVYLPAEKIVATGDIVVTNRADDNPNIHFEKDGTTAGWLTTVKGMVGLNAESYVTGHGEVLTKADLQRKLTATTERRAKIAAMVKEGKTLDEIKAALPDAPAPGAAPRGAGAPGGGRGGGGRGGPPAKTFVETAYEELTKK